MDTVTHIVLGACAGEVLAGRQLGKKALLLGALANSVPDCDFVASFWLPVTDDLLAHRGFTHSIFFVLLAAPLLGWASSRLFARDGLNLRHWTLFWGVQMLTHLLLDSFNAYGTALFLPFSNYRVAFHTMYVADPLFSIWLAIGFVTLLVMRRQSQRRLGVARVALALSITYLLAGIGIKLYIDGKVEASMGRQHIQPNRYFTTPTPLTNLLWFVVAAHDSGYSVGYRSVFDKEEDIRFRFVPKHNDLLALSGNEHDKQLLLRFSQGYYTLHTLHDTLVFNVLRFGDMGGWSTATPGFAFYYYLQYPDANSLIVQRGRVAMWSKKSIDAYIKRIKGI